MDSKQAPLTDEQLDLECTDEDFGEISRNVGGYHQYKNLLGLKQAEIEQIELNPANFYNIQGRFLETLKKWKSKLNAQKPKKYATFGELVKIARKINDGLAIREIETICADRARSFVQSGSEETDKGQGVESTHNMEYQTIVKCTDTLVNGLSASVAALGDVFLGEGFLAPETHEAITSDTPDPKQRTRKLVKALTAKVQTDHQNFCTIVHVLLKQGDWTKDVIQKLRETYEGFGGKQFPGAIVIPKAAPVGNSSAAATEPTALCNHSEGRNESVGDGTNAQRQETVFCDRSTSVPTPQMKALPQNVAAGVAQPTKLWDEAELVVRFLNPNILSDPRDPWICGSGTLTPELVLAWAEKWNREDIPHIVAEGPGKVPHIRVKFASNERSWSKVGNDARNVVNLNEPTMVLNLKETKRRQDQESMVLHEFGHALGLEHEHQRSDFWDTLEKFTIGKDRMKSGDGGNCKEACEEVFRGPNSTKPQMSSKYDPDSIMHYWFDIYWLKPEYQDLDTPSQEFTNLTDKEKDVIRGVHKRHYTKGGLPKGPSEADYKFLQERYREIQVPVRPEPTRTLERAPPDPFPQQAAAKAPDSDSHLGSPDSISPANKVSSVPRSKVLTKWDDTEIYLLLSCGGFLLLFVVWLVNYAWTHFITPK